MRRPHTEPEPGPSPTSPAWECSTEPPAPTAPTSPADPPPLAGPALAQAPPVKAPPSAAAAGGPCMAPAPDQTAGAPLSHALTLHVSGDHPALVSHAGDLPTVHMRPGNSIRLWVHRYLRTGTHHAILGLALDPPAYYPWQTLWVAPMSTQLPPCLNTMLRGTIGGFVVPGCFIMVTLPRAPAPL